MLEITIVVTVILGEFFQAAVIVALLFFNAGMSIWRKGKARAVTVDLKACLGLNYLWRSLNQPATGIRHRTKNGCFCLKLWKMK